MLGTKLNKRHLDLPTQVPTVNLTRCVSRPCSRPRVFIAHPVQIQAVTYIVQRMTSMATMFYLMSSLLFYLLGRQREDLRRDGSAYLARGAWPLWLLALGSKEIAATLPSVHRQCIEYLFFAIPDKALAR